MLFGKKTGGVDWLVVGLGNPGDQYEHTRHNVGFAVADELAERCRVPLQRLKFRALTNTVTLGGQKVLLMKPVTYMNLSGEAVREAAAFYKVPPEHILVLSDEVALPPGKLRVRKGGSAGGHNGLKNIIAHLGSDQFASGWGWARSPTRTTTWPTGSWASPRARTKRRWRPQWSGPPTPWNAFWPRGRRRP